MLPDDHPDRIHVAFDDHRLVANAGLILPATLSRHLGLPQLVQFCSAQWYVLPPPLTLVLSHTR